MKHQHGGTLLGFVLGVVVALAAALAVVYLATKTPPPLVNKVQNRSAGQDDAEAEKNKNWDPNAGLASKNSARPETTQAPAASSPAAPTTASQSTSPSAATAAATSASAPKASSRASAPADPLGDLANSRAAAASTTVYYVQLGAYQSKEDAENQRAQLSLSGVESKIYEKEQSGHTVYRVRVGPFDKKQDGQRNKEALEKSGLTASLVSSAP